MFYSTCGHVWKITEAVAAGAHKVSDNELGVKRVPETLPQELLYQIGAAEVQKAFARVPVATVEALADYDTIILDVPTRYGSLGGQIQALWEATGPLWAKGVLVGKAGGAFVSTASQHGGQETTLRTAHPTLLHHGLVIVGLPYAGADAHRRSDGGSLGRTDKC